MNTPTNEAMIVLDNVTKWYGDFNVLRDCTTSIHKGEVVVVCGPSGSGKSTLIKTVNGLEPIQSGQIFVNGTEVTSKRTNLAALRSRVGMVFQHFELFPHLNIIHNLILAQEKVLKRNHEEAREKALALLSRVGLDQHTEKYPSQLSGGQQQRVAIARALANDPRLILADEPTGALDTRTSVEIMGLIQGFNERGMTVVLVTHEPDIATFARRIVRFRDGRVVSDEPVPQPRRAEAVLRSAAA